MFLSVATTHEPATDLGFLLHKHPDRLHEFELTFGKAFVFYPEASAARCEAALILDIDPVGLVRGKGQGDGLLDQYVNDRPYAASSFLSVALNKAFRTAMSGVCNTRPELAESAIPLEAVVTPVPARGGEKLLRSLFEPLGWNVDVNVLTGPVSGAAGAFYADLKLTGTGRLSALLNHLYVLIPVLDDAKHYFVGEDEIDKLLNRDEGWLDRHPAKELIVRRYLRHRGLLARTALARLAPETQEEAVEARGTPEDALEAPIRLNDQRLTAVVDVLRATGSRSIADLGCGEGKLLHRLLSERWAEQLIGLDPAAHALEWASKRLKLRLPGGPPEGRVSLLHGSLTYRDDRWAGVDAAALVEVIEHLDPDRLPLVERVVFGEARPGNVIVTTPNAEYNARFDNLAAGSFRHPDHRFEWTRAEFRAWADRIETTYGYRASLSGIGQQDELFGTPTQMALFTR
jgi:3' terminal RNA ribose 2'-O-methyltransferase Hen1